MKNVKDKAKKDDTESENRPVLGNDEPFDINKEFERLGTPSLPPISSGIEELDEVFRQAFKKKSPNR